MMGRQNKKTIGARLKPCLSGCLVSGLLIASGVWVKTKWPDSYPVPVASSVTTHEWQALEPITEWKGQEVRFAYLTFDDGPSKNTAAILDILNEREVDGTFFVLGTSIERVEQSEALLNRMVEEGHYIGMHSMSHDTNTLYKGVDAPANFMAEMMEQQALIESITGQTSTLCRAPYGTAGMLSEEHVSLLIESGLKCWDWDVDSWDWSYTSASDVLSKVESDVRLWGTPSRLVVLFHEKNVTLEALPLVIDYLQALGYELLPYDPDQHFAKNLLKNPEL